MKRAGWMARPGETCIPGTYTRPSTALPTKRSKLKEARVARKVLMVKKSHSGGTMTDKTRGTEDGGEATGKQAIRSA